MFARPYGRATAGGWACVDRTVTFTNGVLIWELDDFAPGTGATLTITSLPGQAGTFTNNIFFIGGSGIAIFQQPSVINFLPFNPDESEIGGRRCPLTAWLPLPGRNAASRTCSGR